MKTTFGSLDDARKAVGDLLERYRTNRDRYRSDGYNEETCRAEFITPLFEALGWDVTNRRGAAEQYKDVIHEEGIKVPRQHILKSVTVESIADLRTVRVFGKVPVITMIPVLRKEAPGKRARINIIVPGGNSTRKKVDTFALSHQVSQTALLGVHEAMWRLDLSDNAISFVEKIEEHSLRLGSLCYVNYGAQMSSKEKGGFGKDHVISDKKTKAAYKPMISGRELYRYRIRWAQRYVDYSMADEMYGPRWPEFFELPKVMIRDITGTHRIESTLDRNRFYCDHTVLCALRHVDVQEWKPVPPSDVELSARYDMRFLAGVVGSKLLSAYYYLVLTGEGVRIGGGFHTYPETIRQFPIPRADAPGFDTLSARVSALVGRLLQDAEKTDSARTAFEREQADRHFRALDDELDELLISWYGLADDERRTVDRAVRSREEVIS